MDTGQTLQKARQLIEAGNNDKAHLCLLELLQQDSDNQAALLILGGSYFSSGRFDEAEMVFQRLVLLAPHTGQVSIALFNTLWKTDRHEEALEEIRRFTQHADPETEHETITQYQAITSAIERGEL